jgi:hypothetical protein
VSEYARLSSVGKQKFDGASTKTVKRFLHKHNVTIYRLGGTPFVKTADIDTAIAACAVEPKSHPKAPTSLKELLDRISEQVLVEQRS